MRGKMLRISSEDKAGEEIIGLAGQNYYFVFRFVLQLEIRNIFIANNELYFSKRILEINLIFGNCLLFTFHHTCQSKCDEIFKFQHTCQALKTNTLDNSVEIRLISGMCNENIFFMPIFSIQHFHDFS